MNFFKIIIKREVLSKLCQGITALYLQLQPIFKINDENEQRRFERISIQSQLQTIFFCQPAVNQSDFH